jgi:hypothetical protein
VKKRREIETDIDVKAAERALHLAMQREVLGLRCCNEFIPGHNRNH